MSEINVHEPLNWNCTHEGCGALTRQECRWASDDGPRYDRFHAERVRAAERHSYDDGTVLLVPSKEMIDDVAEGLDLG